MDLYILLKKSAFVLKSNVSFLKGEEHHFPNVLMSSGLNISSEIIFLS